MHVNICPDKKNMSQILPGAISFNLANVVAVVAVISFMFFEFKQMEFNVHMQTMSFQLVQLGVHSVWSCTSSSGNVCSLLMAARDKLSYIERR